MFNNVEIRNGVYGVVAYDTNGNETAFHEKGKEVKLDAICQDIENGEITWRVSFECVGQKKTYEMPRSKIAEKKLAAALQGQGADITAKTFNCFVDSMRWQEAQTTVYQNTYKHLGWIKLLINGQFEYAYRCSKLLGSKSAEYLGNLCLTPKGSLDGWKDMVRSEVLGRPPLETVLLAALAAPIVGIHGLNGTTDNPIFHINYRSGRGKSTACKLAASVSGEPFDGMRKVCDRYGTTKEVSSPYGSWGATSKATISSLAGNRGVVVVLNELGKFIGGDMTTTVFNLSEGSDIKRLNTQLETIVTEGFNTTIISCGEMSLIDRCKSKLEGIRCRVMEMAVPMTDDAEHARRLQQGCENNGGFAAPMIAKYIIENGGYGMVQTLYIETLKELTDSAPAGVSDRFIEKFPIFLVMAAKLADRALGLKFNIDAVVEFCYSCWQASVEDQGEVDQSFEDVINECRTFQHNFFSLDKKEDPKELWGTVSHPKRKEGNKVVSVEYGIRRNILQDILDKYGHPNMKTCLEIWKQAGVLDCEDETHNTRKRMINTKGVKERVYILKVMEDEPPKTTSKLLRQSKVAELLAPCDEENIIDVADAEGGNYA